jgi:UTP:GlnB (protein PII) uridylyltransferase
LLRGRPAGRPRRRAGAFRPHGRERPRGDLAPAIAELSGRFPSQTDAPAPRVEVYLEVSSPRAIVEIRAPDRFGLLYRVGRTIAEKGFSLTAARVDTERGQAIDRFHLESADDRAVDNARLVELRDALVSAAAAR